MHLDFSLFILLYYCKMTSYYVMGILVIDLFTRKPRLDASTSHKGTGNVRPVLLLHCWPSP